MDLHRLRVLKFDNDVGKKGVQNRAREGFTQCDVVSHSPVFNNTKPTYSRAGGNVRLSRPRKRTNFCKKRKSASDVSGSSKRKLKKNTNKRTLSLTDIKTNFKSSYCNPIKHTLNFLSGDSELNVKKRDSRKKRQDNKKNKKNMNILFIYETPIISRKSRKRSNKHKRKERYTSNIRSSEDIFGFQSNSRALNNADCNYFHTIQKFQRQRRRKRPEQHFHKHNNFKLISSEEESKKSKKSSLESSVKHYGIANFRGMDSDKKCVKLYSDKKFKKNGMMNRSTTDAKVSVTPSSLMQLVKSYCNSSVGTMEYLSKRCGTNRNRCRSQGVLAQSEDSCNLPQKTGRFHQDACDFSQDPVRFPQETGNGSQNSVNFPRKSDNFPQKTGHFPEDAGLFSQGKQCPIHGSAPSLRNTLQLPEATMKRPCKCMQFPSNNIMAEELRDSKDAKHNKVSPRKTRSYSKHKCNILYSTVCGKLLANGSPSYSISRNLAKYAFLGLLIITWCPCFFVIAVVWIITYPLKLHQVVTGAKCIKSSDTGCTYNKNYRIYRGTEQQRIFRESSPHSERKGFLTNLSNWATRAANHFVRTRDTFMSIFQIDGKKSVSRTRVCKSQEHVNNRERMKQPVSRPNTGTQQPYNRNVVVHSLPECSKSFQQTRSNQKSNQREPCSSIFQWFPAKDQIRPCTRVTQPVASRSLPYKQVNTSDQQLYPNLRFKRNDIHTHKNPHVLYKNKLIDNERANFLNSDHDQQTRKPLYCPSKTSGKNKLPIGKYMQHPLREQTTLLCQCPSHKHTYNCLIPQCRLYSNALRSHQTNIPNQINSSHQFYHKMSQKCLSNKTPDDSFYSFTPSSAKRQPLTTCLPKNGTRQKSKISQNSHPTSQSNVTAKEHQHYVKKLQCILDNLSKYLEQSQRTNLPLKTAERFKDTGKQPANESHAQKQSVCNKCLTIPLFNRNLQRHLSHNSVTSRNSTLSPSLHNLCNCLSKKIQHNVLKQRDERYCRLYDKKFQVRSPDGPGIRTASSDHVDNTFFRDIPEVVTDHTYKIKTKKKKNLIRYLRKTVDKLHATGTNYISNDARSECLFDSTKHTPTNDKKYAVQCPYCKRKRIKNKRNRSCTNELASTDKQSEQPSQDRVSCICSHKQPFLSQSGHAVRGTLKEPQQTNARRSKLKQNSYDPSVEKDIKHRKGTKFQMFEPDYLECSPCCKSYKEPHMLSRLDARTTKQVKMNACHTLPTQKRYVEKSMLNKTSPDTPFYKRASDLFSRPSSSEPSLKIDTKPRSSSFIGKVSYRNVKAKDNICECPNLQPHKLSQRYFRPGAAVKKSSGKVAHSTSTQSSILKKPNKFKNASSQYLSKQSSTKLNMVGLEKHSTCKCPDRISQFPPFRLATDPDSPRGVKLSYPSREVLAATRQTSTVKLEVKPNTSSSQNFIKKSSENANRNAMTCECPASYQKKLHKRLSSSKKEIKNGSFDKTFKFQPHKLASTPDRLAGVTCDCPVTGTQTITVDDSKNRKPVTEKNIPPLQDSNKKQSDKNLMANSHADKTTFKSKLKVSQIGDSGLPRGKSFAKQDPGRNVEPPPGDDVPKVANKRHTHLCTCTSESSSITPNAASKTAFRRSLERFQSRWFKYFSSETECTCDSKNNLIGAVHQQPSKKSLLKPSRDTKSQDSVKSGTGSYQRVRFQPQNTTNHKLSQLAPNCGVHRSPKAQADDTHNPSTSKSKLTRRKKSLNKISLTLRIIIDKLHTMLARYDSSEVECECRGEKLDVVTLKSDRDVKSPKQKSSHTTALVDQPNNLLQPSPAQPTLPSAKQQQSAKQITTIKSPSKEVKISSDESPSGEIKKMQTVRIPQGIQPTAVRNSGRPSLRFLSPSDQMMPRKPVPHTVERVPPPAMYICTPTCASKQQPGTRLDYPTLIPDPLCRKYAMQKRNFDLENMPAKGNGKGKRKKSKKKKKKRGDSVFTKLWNYITKIKKTIVNADADMWSDDFICDGRVYIHTIKNKPCLCLLRCCPSMYPCFFTMCSLIRSSVTTFLHIVALIFWCPFFCCLYLCCFDVCSLLPTR